MSERKKNRQVKKKERNQKGLQKTAGSAVKKIHQREGAQSK